MSNGGKGGSYSYASLEKQMAAFDALPRSARDELNYGHENWAAYPIRQQWERGVYRDVKQLVKTIKGWNQKRASRDRLRLEAYVNRNDPKPPRTKRRARRRT